MAFLTYRFIYRVVASKTVIWYHNYDVIYTDKNLDKFSLTWLAYSIPKKMFPKIDFFTISMEERVNFFPVHLLKNKYSLIPNYQKIEFHKTEPRIIEDKKIILIFVGTISKGHGLEELISILNTKIENLELELQIKGFLDNDYRQELIKLSIDHDVADKLVILPRSEWSDVPLALRKAHIGISFYMGTDQMNLTLGKGGSTKVFQYIAEGLPVLMNPEFRENFKEYDWAIASNLNGNSLVENISKIISNYDNLSQSAVKSFKEELNCNLYYDHFFETILPNKKH